MDATRAYHGTQCGPVAERIEKMRRELDAWAGVGPISNNQSFEILGMADRLFKRPFLGSWLLRLFLFKAF